MKLFRYIMIAGFFSSVLITSSCNDDMRQEMPELRKPTVDIKYTGETVTLGMDVKLTNDASKTRSFQMTRDGNIIKIDYDALALSGQPMKVYCALRKNGMEDDKVTYFYLEAKVVKDQNGVYKLKAEPKSIQMNTGNLNEGYYIQAMTFGPDTDMSGTPSSGGYTYNMESTKAGFDEPGPIALNNMNIPIATKWTALSVSGGNNITIKNLTFEPLGTIMRLEGINPLAKSVKIKGLKIKTSGFSNKGVFKLGKASGNHIDTNTSVLFEPEGKDAENNYDLNFKLLEDFNDTSYLKTIRPEEDATCYIYVMPIGNSKCNMSYSYAFQLEDDNIEQNTEDESKEIPAGMLASGKVVTLKKTGMPESDLMITEFYHCNPGGANYSMIEIYNPTCRAVDLKNYGLLRLRTFTADGGPGIHPSDRDYTEASALLQELYFDPVKDLSNTRISKNAKGEDYIKITDPSHWASPGAYKVRYKYIEQTEGNAKKADGSMLEPGQTIILCSQKIYWIAQDNTTGEFNKLPTGDYHKFGNKLTENINSGKCKYVMAVTNASSDAQDYQHNTTSGTFTHGLQQIMILSKFEKGKGAYLVDQTGPAFDYTAKYNINDRKGWEEQAKLYDAYVTAFELKSYAGGTQRDDMDFIRRPHVMYPNLIFKYDVNGAKDVKFNSDPTREWDIYLLHGPIANPNNTVYKTVEEKGRLHSWGSR